MAMIPDGYDPDEGPVHYDLRPKLADAPLSLLERVRLLSAQVERVRLLTCSKVTWTRRAPATTAWLCCWRTSRR
jgi:hypothetical protein